MNCHSGFGEGPTRNQVSDRQNKGPALWSSLRRLGWLVGCFAGMLLPMSGLAAFEYSGEIVGAADDCAYSWHRITLRNRTGQRVSYSLRYDSNGRVNLDGKPIEPDGERVLNIAVPLVPDASPILRASDGSGGLVPMKQLGSYQGAKFLHICEIEQFASQKELEDFTKNYETRGGRYRGGYYGSGSSAGSNSIVSQIEPSNLPDNWLCYSPFQAVFARSSALERLGPAERAALNRWVDAGGYLVVYQSEKPETKRQVLGIVSHIAPSPLRMSAEQLPEDWLRRRLQWQQSQSNWSGYSRYSSGGNVPDDQDFPYRQDKPQGRLGAFLLASVFLAIAGPANYFYCRRKGRIRMLMVSLPAVSTVFCLLIIGFFIASQGFTRLGGSFSVTLLDEDRDTALTFSRHSAYSGLYPLGGFRFDSETLFVPAHPEGDFVIDATNFTHLKSGLFHPTTNFQYMTLHHHQTREKLVYDKAAQSVLNGFEKPIESLMVCDGNAFLAAHNIAPGTKAKLERVKPPTEAVAANKKPEDGQDPVRLATFVSIAGLSKREANYLDHRMGDVASPKLREDSFCYYASIRELQPAITQPGLTFNKGGSCQILIGWTGSTSSQTPLAATNESTPGSAANAQPPQL